jgi:hypothetical protein
MFGAVREGEEAGASQIPTVEKLHGRCEEALGYAFIPEFGEDDEGTEEGERAPSAWRH